VGALVIGSVVAASLSTVQLKQSPLPKFSRAPRGPAQPTGFVAPGAPQGQAASSDPGIKLPDWVGPVLLALIAALLLGAIAVLVVLLVRQRDRTRAAALPDDPQVSLVQQRADVLAAVDAGLADLDDGDPRAAVIACWVRLEEAAAAAGTPREPGDTPGELVLRLLGGHQISPGVLYGLAEVYRLARYATHSVDAGMREQARAALGQLRAELTAAPEQVTTG
jgi:hypothetical protein